MKLGSIDVDELPAALTAEEIADLFGVGKDHVYAEVRAHRWPTPVVKLGRTLRFPTLPALEVLGLGMPARDAEASDDPAAPVVHLQAAPDR